MVWSIMLNFQMDAVQKTSREVTWNVADQLAKLSLPNVSDVCL